MTGQHFRCLPPDRSLERPAIVNPISRDRFLDLCIFDISHNQIETEFPHLCFQEEFACFRKRLQRSENHLWIYIDLYEDAKRDEEEAMSQL